MAAEQTLTVTTEAQRAELPIGAVVLSQKGTIACRVDVNEGVVFGHEGVFPWSHLALPLTILYPIPPAPVMESPDDVREYFALGGAPFAAQDRSGMLWLVWANDDGDIYTTSWPEVDEQDDRYAIHLDAIPGMEYPATMLSPQPRGMHPARRHEAAVEPLPEIGFKAEGWTDARAFATVARNLRQGYAPGGSNVTAALERLVRREIKRAGCDPTTGAPLDDNDIAPSEES
ncbi:MAG: hypothetical protein ACLGHM_09735 [Actinomycetes bacterium]